MAESEKASERLPKDFDEEHKEIEDHAGLLDSLRNVVKNETEKLKETADVSHEEAGTIDEDDIDMALKSLHKEDIGEEEVKTTEEEAKHPSVEKADEEEDERQGDEVKDIVKLLPDTEDKEKCSDIKEDKLEEVTTQDDKTENEAHKLAKEIETIEEPDTSTAMEVDEETKKDLIDSFLNEQAAAMEDTAAETPASTESVTGENKQKNIETDEKSKLNLDLENMKELADHENSLEDEFLNITPEKIEKTEDDDLTHTGSSNTVASTSAITGSVTTETAEASSSTKEATITSEERVKSLISEWGDDEDDDDNDGDLTANL